MPAVAFDFATDQPNCQVVAKVLELFDGTKNRALCAQVAKRRR